GPYPCLPLVERRKPDERRGTPAGGEEALPASIGPHALTVRSAKFFDVLPAEYARTSPAGVRRTAHDRRRGRSQVSPSRRCPRQGGRGWLVVVKHHADLEVSGDLAHDTRRPGRRAAQRSPAT